MEKVVGRVGESRAVVCNWQTKEDDEGSVVGDIADLPISADAASLSGWLRDAASYWRSQGKKALWLKLLLQFCSCILLPALQVGYSVDHTSPTYVMLVLTLLDKEPYPLHTNAVVESEARLHFSSNDVREINAEQCRSTFRNSPLIPQWQTQGNRNSEAAERGGTSAKNNASSQPLELVAYLPTSAVTNLGFNSDIAALPRCFEPLSSSAQRQLLSHHSSLVPQWQTQGHRYSEAAETGGTSAENNTSSHHLELSPYQAPSAMIDVEYTSDVAALPRCIERFSALAQKQPINDNVFNTSKPVTETKRRSQASQPHPARQTKRSRSTNWTHSQKLYLLKNRLKYKLTQKHEAAGKPDSWFQSVANSYSDEHGTVIKPRRWQDQMDTLGKQFKAICAYEEAIESGRSTCVSFWKLSEDERRDARTTSKYLPLSFDQEMFQLMKRMNEIPKVNKPESSRGRQVQVRDLRQSPSNLGMDSTISAGPSDGNRSSQESPHVLSISGVGSLEGIEGETVSLNAGNRLLNSTASTIDDEELFAKIGPFVKQKIEDAIQPLLLAMQKRKEDEENYRQKKLALQQQQLAVMRQKMALTRNDVCANTYGAPNGEVDSSINPNLEHGQDPVHSYFADVEPQEAFPNFEAWNHIPGQ